MNALLIAVPALPMIAVPFSLLAGRRLRFGGGELMVGATALSLIALVLLFGRQQTLQATWFESGGLRLTVGLSLDRLTGFVATMVACIALLVGIFSLGYMADEDGRPRFYALLAFFVATMLTLVLSSSLVLLFAAWEAVGIASFLLIGFRYAEGRARDAAIKAFLMTRIGDFGFLLGWLLALAALRTTDIATLLSAASAGALPAGTATLIALLMFLAAIGKSAQLPLTAWLPDAMIAPTPVSALLHSATMVAAGVFLLLRLYPLFAAAPGALASVAVVGGATALFSAVVATGEMDLKRVLAWCTSSHLGQMMLALGLGGPLAASLALTTHAIAKSALFTVAGAVDKATGTRDLRRLGGLARRLPTAALAYLTGGLSLAGIQLYSFQSSDDAAIGVARAAGAVPMLLVFLAIFLGGAYIARAGIAAFSGSLPAGTPYRPPHRMLTAGVAALGVAAALASLVVTYGPAALPFGPEVSLPLGWRVAGALCGAAGLAAGGLHAWRRHAAPMMWSAPAVLERALVALTGAPVRMVLAVASGVSRVEDWLDRAARGLAGAASALARGTDRIERQDFGAGADGLAAALQAGGGQVRRIETGKIYLYTLGLFVWTLGATIAGVFMLGR